MISFTSTQLEAWLAMLIFPLARILAMIASAPILGNKQVPVRVKVGLSVLLTIVISPTLGELPPVSVGSFQGLLIMIQQIIIGLALGFSIRLIFAAVDMVGELAGLQMGLGFASFYDPLNSSYTPIVANWLGMIAMLAFLSMNGHLHMLFALAESFRTLPIGGMMAAKGFYEIASLGGNIFVYGLQLSLPILTALLTTNIALGILTRAAPQLNLFAIGFPVTLAIGFIVMILFIPYFIPLLDRLAQEGLGAALNLAKPGQR